MTNTGAAAQTTVGDKAKDQEHSHPEVIHVHDHYHVTHRHTGGPFGEFEHKARYHSHEHNHAALVHGHSGGADEDDEHEKDAHVHDHEMPTGGGL